MPLLFCFFLRSLYFQKTNIKIPVIHSSSTINFEVYQIVKLKCGIVQTTMIFRRDTTYYVPPPAHSAEGRSTSGNDFLFFPLHDRRPNGYVLTTGTYGSHFSFRRDFQVGGNTTELLGFGIPATIMKYCPRDFIQEMRSIENFQEGTSHVSIRSN